MPVRNAEEGWMVNGEWGGLTAMATYSLLAAGESPQSEPVAKGIAWLNKADVIGTYAMGMKLQIWNYIERRTEEQKKVLRKDATLLLNAVHTGGGKAGNLGLYHYFLDPTKGDYDHSCSNYGVLGMWAAAQQNLEVPTRTGRSSTKRGGEPAKEGGWSYLEPRRRVPGSMSMTAAGVATLFITQEYSTRGRAGSATGTSRIRTSTRAEVAERPLPKSRRRRKYYAMYGIERIGAASGYKYFGTIDWYRTGRRMLAAQKKRRVVGRARVLRIEYVWAILFLVQGACPIDDEQAGLLVDTAGDKDRRIGTSGRATSRMWHWTGKQSRRS